MLHVLTPYLEQQAHAPRGQTGQPQRPAVQPKSPGEDVTSGGVHAIWHVMLCAKQAAGVFWDGGPGAGARAPHARGTGHANMRLQPICYARCHMHMRRRATRAGGPFAQLGECMHAPMPADLFGLRIPIHGFAPAAYSSEFGLLAPAFGPIVSVRWAARAAWRGQGLMQRTGCARDAPNAACD